MRQILKEKRCFIFFDLKWNCLSFVYYRGTGDFGSCITENSELKHDKRMAKSMNESPDNPCKFNPDL